MRIKYVKNKIFQIEKWINKLFLKGMFFLPLIMGCNFNTIQKIKFHIDLYDCNSSMSYTMHYHFDNKYLTVVKIGILVNESNDTLIIRKLNKDEIFSIKSFLHSFSKIDLKNKYVNNLIEDGDQKRIDISINNDKKSIIVRNFYHKDIDNLIKLLNQLLDEKLKIKYNK